jgi:hypothetical protein
MERKKFMKVLVNVLFAMWFMSALPMIIFVNASAMTMSMGETLTQITMYVFAFAWMIPLVLLVKETH